MFTSRPLADAQAELSDKPESAGVSASAGPRRAVPVVDINFDDIPEQDYEEFAFPLKTEPGIVWVLGIDDDAILFEIMEAAREDSPNEIIEFCLTSTFRYAVDKNGHEVDNGLRKLMNAIDPHRKGPRESRKYLMEVVLSAIDRWCEELTDTSMRTPSRAQRRARSRRR